MKNYDPHIVEGLIGIGYDIRIFDIDGKFPGGLSREAYEKERIDELFASQTGDAADAINCECGGYTDLEGIHQPCRAISRR